MTKSLILVTNVTFPSDSNHTCESTVKKNLTHVSNVTTSVSGLNKTRKHVVKTLKLKYYELRNYSASLLTTNIVNLLSTIVVLY